MRQSRMVGRALRARRGGSRCIGTRPTFSSLFTDALRLPPLAGRGCGIPGRIGRTAMEQSSGPLDLGLTGFLPVERPQLAGFPVGRVGQAPRRVFETGIRFRARSARKKT